MDRPDVVRLKLTASDATGGIRIDDPPIVVSRALANRMITRWAESLANGKLDGVVSRLVFRCTVE